MTYSHNEFAGLFVQQPSSDSCQKRDMFTAKKASYLGTCLTLQGLNVKPMVPFQQLQCAADNQVESQDCTYSALFQRIAQTQIGPGLLQVGLGLL